MNRIPVLIIEDDENDYLEIATRLLESGEDLDLQHCTRLNDALALLERQMEFDLVFVDLSLPGLVHNSIGYAYEIIRQKLPTAKIIVLTGNQDPRLAEQIKADGGEFFIKGETLCGDSKTLMMRLFAFLATQQIQAASQRKNIDAQRVEFASLRNQWHEQWRSLTAETHLLERRSMHSETALLALKTALKTALKQISVNGSNAKLALETVVQLKQQPLQARLTAWQLGALIIFAGMLWSGFAIAAYLLLPSR